MHEDLAFRVLAACSFPVHRTIRDFRAFRLKELSELFVQVVFLARERALVKRGTIAADGTKAMSSGHMLKAEAVFEALAHSGREPIVALGLEGKDPSRFDPERSPHAGAMAARLQTEQAEGARGSRAQGQPWRLGGFCRPPC